MLITVETIKALDPCYDDDALSELLHEGVQVRSALTILLSLPADDARWVLARILTVENRVRWAKDCAARAKRYAADAASYAASSAAYTAADAAADAASSAAYASAYAYTAADAASSAAYASACADADAASYAASSAAYASAYASAVSAADASSAADDEHKLACVLALELLVTQ
jgi:hypothetical protein